MKEIEIRTINHNLEVVTRQIAGSYVKNIKDAWKLRRLVTRYAIRRIFDPIILEELYEVRTPSGW